MYRKLLLSGIILCGLSVLLGAFGAHALKALLTPEKLITFETGVRYQFMHGLALILFAMYLQQNNAYIAHLKQLRFTGSLFLVGVLFFSGSLYALALQPIISVQYSSWIGPITPLGGLCFITGWALWARAIYLNKVDN